MDYINLCSSYSFAVWQQNPWKSKTINIIVHNLGWLKFPTKNNSLWWKPIHWMVFGPPGECLSNNIDGIFIKGNSKDRPPNQAGPPFQQACNTTLIYVSLVVWKIICRDYPKCARKDHRWTQIIVRTFHSGGVTPNGPFVLVYSFFDIPNWFFDSQGIIRLKNEKHVPNPPILWFPVSSYCFHMFFVN